MAWSSDALRESRRVGADVHTPVRSDMLRDSRRVGTDVHTHERATYARRGKPPSWRGLRMRHESQGVKAFKCTHLNVKHTLAGASPAVVARSSDALRESRCVDAQVHTPERGACSPRLQGSSPCSLSNAKMSTMHQHCEHALPTPRPFGPWEYCRVALLAPLAG